MRPPAGADTNECLRVLRPRGSSGNLLPASSATGTSTSNDYLIPLSNHRSSAADLASSGASVTDDGPSEQCGYWETSFTREGVKAIARGEPLPEANGNAVNLSLGDLRSGSTKRRSKGYATVPTFEAPTLSQSQSSQPLLGTPPDSPPADAANDSLPLDASNLCRQSYANVRIATNPSAGSTPSRATPPTKRSAAAPNEISC